MLAHAGAISGAPRWRPSLRKKLDAHQARLTEDEQAQAEAILNGERPSTPPRPEVWGRRHHGRQLAGAALIKTNGTREQTKIPVPARRPLKSPHLR